MRVCNKCNINKDDFEFRDNRLKCKKCSNIETYQRRLKKIAINPNEKIKQCEYLKEYRKLNKDKRTFNDRRKYILNYNKNRIKNDIEFRITKNLRSRLYHAAKGSTRINYIDLCGIDKKGLKEYLESKFTDGMSWSNYGKWHIDHIRPCISFDLKDISQQKECFHYTNLQPLWAKDNRIKSGKYVCNSLQSTPQSSQDTQ